MKLKCINSNKLGYFQEGECYKVKEIICNTIKIEVIANWTNNKPDIYDIQCTEEEFKSGLIKDSLANFEIIK